VGAGFCAEPATRGNVIEIKAHEAAKYVDQGPLWGEPQELQMFKLYRREADKKLFYREAWIDGERVVEHWGACGERGDVREHPAPNAKDAQRVLSRLKRAARDDGFKPIPRSRMATLIVEYPIDPCRSGDDLTRRHELEDRLNELIGWLGLGHMDGGSIGSGTMEVCLIVVDFQIAKDTLEEAMRGTDMDGFSQIYRLK
jgi:predicted DNA-binding WGR domain protein